jgi:hypothetical protein
MLCRYTVATRTAAIRSSLQAVVVPVTKTYFESVLAEGESVTCRSHINPNGSTPRVEHFDACLRVTSTNGVFWIILKSHRGGSRREDVTIGALCGPPNPLIVFLVNQCISVCDPSITRCYQFQLPSKSSDTFSASCRIDLMSIRFKRGSNNCRSS